jgi:FAD synthetase
MNSTTELKNLVSKYIANVEQVFEKLQVLSSQTEVSEVLDCAKRYLDDAKFFMNKGNFKHALIAIVYCEGLIDALRMLKLAAFSWYSDRTT